MGQLLRVLADGLNRVVPTAWALSNLAISARVTANHAIGVEHRERLEGGQISLHQEYVRAEQGWLSSSMGQKHPQEEHVYWDTPLHLPSREWFRRLEQRVVADRPNPEP